MVNNKRILSLNEQSGPSLSMANLGLSESTVMQSTVKPTNVVGFYNFQLLRRHLQRNSLLVLHLAKKYLLQTANRFVLRHLSLSGDLYLL